MSHSSFVQWTSLLLLALLATGAELRGQQSPLLLRVGEVARITAPEAPGGRVVGSVQMLDADSVVLSVSGPTERVVLPLPSITVAELGEGRNRAKGALVGAGMGAVGAVMVGYACNIFCAGGSHVEPGFLIASVVYLPAMGGIVGAVLAPRKWTRLPLRAR